MNKKMKRNSLPDFSKMTLDQIARRIKDTRDKTFRATATTSIREKQVAMPDASGTFREIVTDVEREFTVNRAEGIAHVLFLEEEVYHPLG